MIGAAFTSTRRSLLRGFVAAGTVTWPAFVSGLAGAAEPDLPRDDLPPLRRTPEGRALSRARYHRAEGFFRGEARLHDRISLYNVGIVLQLGLSSHLLDVGFDDAWCARHIGLHVDKSLGYANATGLDAGSHDLATLAVFLSPYGQWRNEDVEPTHCHCPFVCGQIRQLTRGLLDRVREVTGHRRPQGSRGDLV